MTYSSGYKNFIRGSKCSKQKKQRILAQIIYYEDMIIELEKQIKHDMKIELQEAYNALRV